MILLTGIPGADCAASRAMSQRKEFCALQCGFIMAVPAPSAALFD
jgi:hypothetical protein